MKKYILIVIIGLVIAGGVSASWWSDFFGTEELGKASTIYQPNILPEADSTYDLGSSANRWANIYSDLLNLTDLIVVNSTTTNATTTGSLYITNDLTVAGDTTLVDVIITNYQVNGNSTTTGYQSIGTDDGNFNFTAGDINAAGELHIAEGGVIMGNVGIGTTTPLASISVQGGGNDILRLADSNGTEKVVVDNDGNVGIGTTNPSYELDVSGFVNAKSNYQVSDEGLVLGMNFNSETITGTAGSETVLDSSVYNNHGTNNGATATTTGFNDGGAFDFDGSNDYIENTVLPDDTFDNDFTISFWTSPGELVAETNILHKKDGINAGVAIQQVSSSQVRFFYEDTNGARTILPTISSPMSVGQWVYVTCVRNTTEDKLYIYINGVENVSAVDATIVSRQTTNSLFIGTNLVGGDFYKGKIDNVKIYNRVLSADEIKAQYLQRAEVGDSYVSQTDIFVDSSGNVGIGITSPSQVLSVAGNVLADAYLEYSPKYIGDALSKIKNIKHEQGTEKGDWAKVDHSTLPEGVRVENQAISTNQIGVEIIEHEAEYEEKVLIKEAWTEEIPIIEETEYTFIGRNLGASVQLNTRAIQQLIDRVEALEAIKLGNSGKSVAELETRIEELENRVGIIERFINWIKNLW